MLMMVCLLAPSFAVADVVEVEGEVISPTLELDEQEEVVPDVSLFSTPFTGADQGNWTVGSCIIVKMAAQLTIKPEKNNQNKTVVVEVPVSAKVSDTSSCEGKGNTTQTITLQWAEGDMKRNVTLTFAKNTTTQQYGVSKISAVYELKYINKSTPQPGPDNSTIYVNETVLVYISLSTFGMDPMEFLVPENRSYLCVDVGAKSLIAELHRTDEDGGSPGERLFNTTLSAKKVQFDAFRGPHTFPDEFQTPSDCSYRPNDVVPIIVGCALAALVLMVLIAYLIGRRKSRARGYQSV